MDLERQRYIKNVKKPMKDEYGTAQLLSMNERHNELALWGISTLENKGEKTILDIGCGGGKNIENMLDRVPDAKVSGLDYSEASVEMSIKHNEEKVKSGQVDVKQGSAENMPYKDNTFDLVTGFETIYFWDLEKGFKEVKRVLKKGGRFMIVQECDRPEDLAEYIKIVGFSVYTMDEIVDSLKKCGFKIELNVRHSNTKWITVIASK